MWDIIEIGADLFQAVLAIYFMRKTCNLRTHPLRYDFLAIMLMASSIFITSQFEVYLIDSINDIIPMLFAMLFTQNRKYTCVFWAVISSIIVAVGTSISSTIIARLTGASWERMLEQNNVRITYLISANMLIAGIYIFVGNLGSKSHPISQAAMACFLITVIAQLAAAECFFTVGITLEKDVISVIGSLFLFVSMVITVAIYETMMQQAQKQKDLEVAYQTTQLINAHQEELKTMYSSMLSVQHDLRHRIAAAEEILSHNHSSSADEAINLLKDSEVLQQNITGSIATDAVLTSKIALMDTHHIIFLFYPIPLGKLPLPESRFAVLISNLLDNAIEGVMRLPESSEQHEIELLFNRTWDIFSIICKNNANPETIVKRGDQFLSSKPHPSMHGYGTRNIRSTVEEAGGLVDFVVEDNQFIVKIILPLEEQEC